MCQNLLYLASLVASCADFMTRGAMSASSSSSSTSSPKDSTLRFFLCFFFSSVAAALSAALQPSLPAGYATKPLHSKQKHRLMSAGSAESMRSLGFWLRKCRGATSSCKVQATCDNGPSPKFSMKHKVVCS